MAAAAAAPPRARAAERGSPSLAHRDEAPVAILVDDLGFGGAERMIRRVAEGLAARGVAVDLLVASGAADAARARTARDRLQVLPLEAKGRAGVAAFLAGAAPLASLGRAFLLFTLMSQPRRYPRQGMLPALCAYLRRERPRRLLAPAVELLLLAHLARSLTGVPVDLVASFRSHLSGALGDRSERRARELRWLLAPVLRDVEAVHAVSRSVADDLALTVGVPRERIVAFHNPTLAVDVRTLAAEPVDHPWYADKRAPIVLAVGRLAPQKDYPTLIRAFALARAVRPMRLAIVGPTAPGSKGRAGRLERLAALASELGVGGDVDFIGPRSNALAWMAGADVFALSSRYEGLPNVVIEALACGRSVVATDAPGGTREILADGAYGHLVPVGDAHALAGALLRALDRPADPERQRARAREYGPDASLDRYEALLARRPARRETVGAAARKVLDY